jgi:hypothetical protein
MEPGPASAAPPLFDEAAISFPLVSQYTGTYDILDGRNVDKSFVGYTKFTLDRSHGGVGITFLGSSRPNHILLLTDCLAGSMSLISSSVNSSVSPLVCGFFNPENGETAYVGLGNNSADNVVFEYAQNGWNSHDSGVLSFLVASHDGPMHIPAGDYLFTFHDGGTMRLLLKRDEQ